MSNPKEPPNHSFVVWYGPDGEPAAVYYRSDAYAEGRQCWFPADSHNAVDGAPAAWDALCRDLRGFRGPSELIPGGPLS